MKFTVFLIFLIVVISWPVVGQNHDFGLWGQKNLQSGEKLIFPWYSYYGEKGPAVDLRYNFEAAKTGTICVGKKFGTDLLTFTPEACGLVGRSSGFGPALVLFGEKGKNEFYLLTEYIKMVDKKDLSFSYSWIEYHREVLKHISVGAGGQVWKENKATGKIELGPSVKFNFGKTYFRIWPSWSLGPTGKGELTVLLGIGYRW